MGRIALARPSAGVRQVVSSSALLRLRPDEVIGSGVTACDRTWPNMTKCDCGRPQRWRTTSG
eukprot:7594808-Pyramimonas_sp.AAC.1